MKKTMLILALLFAWACSFGQLKKQTKSSPEINQGLKLDSTLRLDGLYKTDTVKVAVQLLVDDGSIVWKQGYQINTNFTYAGGYIPYSTLLTDRNFKPFKKEEVEAIVTYYRFQWK